MVDGVQALARRLASATTQGQGEIEGALQAFESWESSLVSVSSLLPPPTTATSSNDTTALETLALALNRFLSNNASSPVVSRRVLCTLHRFLMRWHADAVRCIVSLCCVCSKLYYRSLVRISHRCMSFSSVSHSQCTFSNSLSHSLSRSHYPPVKSPLSPQSPFSCTATMGA